MREDHMIRILHHHLARALAARKYDAASIIADIILDIVGPRHA